MRSADKERRRREKYLLIVKYCIWFGWVDPEPSRKRALGLAAANGLDADLASSECVVKLRFHAGSDALTLFDRNHSNNSKRPCERAVRSFTCRI